MTVQFDFDFNHVETILQRLLDRTRNYSPAWEKVGIQAERSTGMNFRASGRPTKWAPLAPKTLASRRKRGKGGKILQDNGLLKASVTSNASIKRISAQRIEFGTNLSYASVQQNGTARIPARPFLMWQDTDLQIAKRIFLDHLRQGGV